MHDHRLADHTGGMQSVEKALHCVIVDDNPAFIHAAAHFLGHQGIDVVGVAFTIEEALSCVSRLRPDVTIADIHLGEESGFELAERLCDEPMSPAVILTSTHSQLEFADMIAASPALGFVPKVDLSVDSVRRLLDEVANERHLRVQ
jgi:DNA-binding NarL/FixJ family response regulator